MAETKNTMSNTDAAPSNAGNGKLIVMNSKEKDDLHENLPSEWSTPQHLGQATIYNMKMSPPCCKIRTIFSWYKVDYKTIDGKKKDSEYKKVPVVIVQNRQINDSFIVVKSLARILDGAELNKELLAIEEMTTYGLMVALEVDVAGSCTDLVKCGQHMGGCFCCILTSFSCCLCCIGPGNIRSKHPELKGLEYYSEQYKKALGTQQYFHGDKPGIVDVSICGVLAPFAQAGNTSTMTKFLGSSGPLFEWYNRMKPNLPKIF